MTDQDRRGRRQRPKAGPGTRRRTLLRLLGSGLLRSFEHFLILLPAVAAAGLAAGFAFTAPILVGAPVSAETLLGAPLVALFVGVCALSIIVPFGVPAHVVLSILGWRSVWAYAAAGAMIPFALLVLPRLLRITEFTSAALHHAARPVELTTVALGAASGAAGGWAFHTLRTQLTGRSEAR